MIYLRPGRGAASEHLLGLYLAAVCPRDRLAGLEAAEERLLRHAERARLFDVEAACRSASRSAYLFAFTPCSTSKAWIWWSPRSSVSLRP